MRWTVHGERRVYDSPWVALSLVDVEIPGERRRFEHHVVRYPAAAVGAVVVRPEDSAVLLLWRHRFITDTWGWEVPAGRVEAGETPEQAAERETLEETGWRSGPMRRRASYHPSSGSADLTFHIAAAESAEYVGEPTDAFEAARVEWVALETVRELVLAGQVHNGLSYTALLHVLAFGPHA